MQIKCRIRKNTPDKKQRGVTAIEYAIIGMAISAIVLAMLTTDNKIKRSLTGAMSTISSNVDAAKKQ